MVSRPLGTNAAGRHRALAEALAAHQKSSASLAAHAPTSGTPADQFAREAHELHDVLTTVLSRAVGADRAPTQAEARRAVTTLALHDDLAKVTRHLLVGAGPQPQLLQAIGADEKAARAIRAAVQPFITATGGADVAATAGAPARAPRRLVKQQSRPPWGRIAAAVVIPLILLALVGWRALALQQTALAAKQDLLDARSALGGGAVQEPEPVAPASAAATPDVTSACTAAASADAALQDVNKQLSLLGPIIGALDSVPGLGTQAQSQASSLAIGSDLASTGVALCQGLQPIADVLNPSTLSQGDGSTSDVMQSLAEARPQLQSALDRLTALQSSLDSVQTDGLDTSTRDSVTSLRERLPQAISELRDGMGVLDLLGGNGTPRRYLVVSQNPDELRASGGYVGSAGIAEVTDGRVQLMDYGSSRRYDTPSNMRVTPPESFAPYLGTGIWELAGANWWPSFPADARQMVYLYGLTHPDQPLDGVIALDQTGLASLLGVLGPVTVPDYGETVDATNVESELDKYIHDYDVGTDVSRKQFAAALSTAVLNEALTAPRSKLPDVVLAVQDELNSQHLLIAAAPEDAAQVLSEKRWDGRLLPATGDSLMLVDTEVSSSKQSQEVSRTATYQVDLTAAGGPRAHLEVQYTNSSNPSARPGVQFIPEYRTYLRAYVPADAQLLGSSGFQDPATSHPECGRSALSGQVDIATGQTVRVTLDYQLPAGIQNGTAYDLVAQQQPGVTAPLPAVTVITAAGTIQSGAVSGQQRAEHWTLDETGSSVPPILPTAPLPAATLDDCDMPLVQSQPVAAPAAIEIPAIQVSAPVTELGISADQQLEAPPTPDVPGWYTMSARPGQPGNSVLAGHVDWGTATAVFWGLRDLKAGDQIIIRSADGLAHTYAVQWNRTYPASTAPVADILAGTPDPELTLITCDGTFDHSNRQYSDRRVVRAVLVPNNA